MISYFVHNANTNTYARSGEYTGHRNSKYTVECSLNKDDDHVISGSDDGFIYVWDLIDGKIKHKLAVSSATAAAGAAATAVHTVATHPEKDFLITATGSNLCVFAPPSYEPPAAE